MITPRRPATARGPPRPNRAIPQTAPAIATAGATAWNGAHSTAAAVAQPRKYARSGGGTPTRSPARAATSPTTPKMPTLSPVATTKARASPPFPRSWMATAITVAGVAATTQPYTGATTKSVVGPA